MSNRRFGVEIEHAHPGGPEGARRAIKEAGLERFIHSHGMDGSGVETRTQPLQGQEGFNALRDIFSCLTASGGIVSSLDGMHVHFECVDYANDLASLVRLVESWTNNAQHINAFVAPRRRTRQPWTQQQLTELKNPKTRREVYDARASMYRWVDNNKEATVADKTRMFGRNSLNICPLSRVQKTIEIRLFQGCLDFDAAEAWIKFCQRFIDSCATRKKPIEGVKSCADLLGRLRMPGELKERLLSGQTANTQMLSYDSAEFRRIRGY